MQIVIVPQALRLAGPPAISTCIMLVKGTSIVSVIGSWELTMAGSQVVERTLAPFQVFGGVAACYFIVCGSLALLRQLASDGMTMILVTHEMQFAREVADTIVFMAEGAVVETGPPAQLLTAPQSDRLQAFLRRYREAYLL